MNTVPEKFFCRLSGITGVQEKKARKREHKPEKDKKRCKHQQNQKLKTEVACTVSQQNQDDIQNTCFSCKGNSAVYGDRFRMRGERIEEIAK